MADVGFFANLAGHIPNLHLHDAASWVATNAGQLWQDGVERHQAAAQHWQAKPDEFISNFPHLRDQLQSITNHTSLDKATDIVQNAKETVQAFANQNPGDIDPQVFNQTASHLLDAMQQPGSEGLVKVSEQANTLLNFKSGLTVDEVKPLVSSTVEQLQNFVKAHPKDSVATHLLGEFNKVKTFLGRVIS